MSPSEKFSKPKLGLTRVNVVSAMYIILYLNHDLLQVTLNGGEVVTQHVHGVPVVQDVPIPAHRPLPDPLETQLGKFSHTCGGVF